MIFLSSPAEYKQRIIRLIRYTAIAVLVFAIGLLSPYTSFFLGLILGTVVGLAILLHTAWKVNKIAAFAAEGNNNQRKPAFVGLTTRFLLALLLVALVYQYPNQVNIVSTLIGLFIAQTILVVDGIIHKN